MAEEVKERVQATTHFGSGCVGGGRSILLPNLHHFEGANFQMGLAGKS